MKKLLLILLLYTPGYVIGQSLANWNLTTDNSVSGSSPFIETGSPTLNNLVVSETGSYGTNTGMKVAPNAAGSSFSWIGSPSSQTALKGDRYIQFTIKPKTGYKINITKLVSYLATAGSNGGRVGIKFSKSALFTPSWDINGNVEKPVDAQASSNTTTKGTFDNPVALFSGNTTVDDNALWKFDLDGVKGVSITDTETLYVRIYITINTSTDGKYIQIRNLSLNGEVKLLEEDFTNTEATLPISLINYSAKTENTMVNLNWSTSSESENSHFEIFKAVSDGNFKFLGKVNGNLNSNTIRNYNFTDFNPNKGTNYYKLVQIDLNGKRNELGINDVYFGMDQNIIKTWPNPFSTELNVELDSNTSYFEITDINGKVIESFNAKSTSTFKIQTSNYPSGVYLLKSEDKDGKQTITKAIKN